MEFIMLISLFFPWIRIVYSDGIVVSQYAFSQFVMYIGYLLIIVIALIPFFLLSHTKKENIRAKLPFRLSDTQAIVYVMSIVMVILINMITINSIYSTRIAQSSTLEFGFKMTFASVVCILISSYFLSGSTKTANTDMYYIDHPIDADLSKYKNILEKENDIQKKNMSLPI